MAETGTPGYRIRYAGSPDQEPARNPRHPAQKIPHGRRIRRAGSPARNLRGVSDIRGPAQRETRPGSRSAADGSGRPDRRRPTRSTGDDPSQWQPSRRCALATFEFVHASRSRQGVIQSLQRPIMHHFRRIRKTTPGVGPLVLMHKLKTRQHCGRPRASRLAKHMAMARSHWQHQQTRPRAAPSYQPPQRTPLRCRSKPPFCARLQVVSMFSRAAPFFKAAPQNESCGFV